MTCRFSKMISALLIVSALILSGAISFSAQTRILGDADGDGKITVIDATCIQRTLAKLPVKSGIIRSAADVDGSGEIEITDATAIQRWLAGLQTRYPVGDRFEAPTEPTQLPTDEEGWTVDIFRP